MYDPKQDKASLLECSQELMILNEIARTLNESVELPALLDQALIKVADLLHLKTGWILLFDEESGEPFTAAVLNLPSGLRKEPERMNGSCYCLDIFKSGNLPDASNIGIVKCSRLQELSLSRGDDDGLAYHASIPLIAHKKDKNNEPYRIGMLNVASSQWRRLTNDELGLLYTIGEMLSVAIERARLYARRLETVQTEERLRLAREIHDTIAQHFSAIAFQLEAAEARLHSNNSPDEIRKSIATSLELAHDGLEELRRSVFNLRSASLEGRSIKKAITSLIDIYNARENLDIHFKTGLPEEGVTLPPSVETGLFRIIQESLQNVHRHADAARVTINLEIIDDGISLTIEDDGKGFDFNEISKMTGYRKFGLVGMRERVHLLGGDFKIESTPGSGTRIIGIIPLSGNNLSR